FNDTPTLPALLLLSLFFFNDPATTEIYTLSLHDALPISALEDELGAHAQRDQGIEPATDAAVQHHRHLVADRFVDRRQHLQGRRDRKSTRLNSSHLVISYAVFCLKKKKNRDMCNY